MNNTARKRTLHLVNDRRKRKRNAPGFHSRKGRALVDGLTRSELLKKYGHAVKSIAFNIASRITSQVDPEDLISVGMIGLLDAAERFDPSRGVKFMSYAELRIRGTILDELRNQDWVPISARKRAKAIETAAQNIERSTGHKATQKEIGAEMGISEEDVQGIQNTYGALSLVYYMESVTMEKEQEKAFRAAHTGCCELSPFEMTDQKSTRAWLEELLAKLPEDFQIVISCHYFRDLKFKEIAEILGVSESRISQMHAKALINLKRMIARNNGDPKTVLSALLAA